MSKYSIGFDFGSLSVRGLLVDVDTGEEIESAVYEYPHGIFADELPDGTKLPGQFALQDPRDYLDGIRFCSREIVKKSGVSTDDIVGIGLDSTASTILPIDKERKPLCVQDEFSSNPHAWLKLWKHHGASDQAWRMKETAKRMDVAWIKAYGGVLSSEWFLPKALELAECAPEVYTAADSIIEVVDWVREMLTGEPGRSEALAACNCCYRRQSGFPSNTYFKEVSPKADGLVKEKFKEAIYPLGSSVGVLHSAGAKLLGLNEGTCVATPIVDSHACVSASGACRPGDMVYICGTSGVEILLAEKESAIPGIHISAQDASIPGYYSFGSGQCCVGDGFSWFVQNCVPQSFVELAKEAGVDIFTYLNQQAEKLKPGESGLLALDWWNGVRTPFFRFDLSGVLFGMNIRTRPEEIWRALLEANGFNVRKSVEKFKAAGHSVNRIFAAGGIPQKNPMLMQILADVLQKEIYVCKSSQMAALGSAILGAASYEQGSFETVAARMHSAVETTYEPRVEYAYVYDKLFTAYDKLTDYYGQNTEVFDLLNELKESAK